MENGEKGRRLRSLNSYLYPSLKFYELKNERISRIIFIIILLTSFLGSFIPEIAYLTGVIEILSITLVYLASTVYLMAFIRDLRGQEYSAGECFLEVAANAPKILPSSVTYILTAALTVGFRTIPEQTAYETVGLLALFLVIPVTVIYLMFLFNVCYIVDKKTGILGSYAASRSITAGRKGQLFLKFMGFNFLLAVPTSLVWVISLSSGNVLIVSFVFSFTSAILNLMQQRFTALMYMDLEYGENRYGG